MPDMSPSSQESTQNACGGHAANPVVGAVLLAAGSGSRMGNRPKSLLELDGVSLIHRQLLALSGANELVVVVGHHADQIEQALSRFPVTVVRNADPDAGQDASLRSGLRRLSPSVDTVLIALADQPLICSQDIHDLMQAYHHRPEGKLLVRPFVEGLPGNPVVFSSMVRDQILATEAHTGCRHWQAAHPEAVHRWNTPNQHYRIDVDSPADLDAFTRNTGFQLVWPGHLG